MDTNPETISTGSEPSVARLLSDGVSRLSKGAHSGIDAASQAAVPAIERMASGAHNAVNKADDFAAHTADTIGGKSDRLVKASSNYVHEHPIVALSLAVATGYLLSRLFTSHKPPSAEQ